MGVSKIGVDYRGRSAYLDSAAAEWYTLWLNRMKVDHPGIKVVVVQAIGDAKASAGIHRDGWCLDFQTWHLSESEILTLITHLRKWGAPATWARDSRDGMEPHIHAAIDSEGRSVSYYQIADVKNGRNGLANRGGDRYKACNPSRWLTYREARDILKAQEGSNDSMADAGTIADLAAQHTWGATFGRTNPTSAGQLLAKAADQHGTADMAAVQTLNATLGSDGIKVSSLLWEAGVNTPNRLKALEKTVVQMQEMLVQLLAKQ